MGVCVCALKARLCVCVCVQDVFVRVCLLSRVFVCVLVLNTDTHGPSVHSTDAHTHQHPLPLESMSDFTGTLLSILLWRISVEQLLHT